MIEWIRVEKTVNEEGTTITYQDKQNRWLIIQSRKRHIPHANREGTWDHTTYHVIVNGEEVKTAMRFVDAKEWVEEVYG